MTKITLQFHADRREILALLEQQISGLQLQVAIGVFRPEYRMHALDQTEQLTDFTDYLDEVVLYNKTIKTGAHNTLEFAEANPGALTLQLGRQTESTLSESFLGSMTDDPDLLKLWRKLRNSLKRPMMKGAWIVNTMSGARERADSHLYTEGAKTLMTVGVRIVGPTGMVEYLLD